jgi:ribosome-associated heat shock protein Hsp15
MANAGSDSGSDGESGAVRLDKWVWAARFFKTRQLAIDAINAGRIDVNGERAKPSKAIRIGDALLLRKPPYAYHLVVRSLGEKRVSATLARTLYEELPESVAAREALAREQRDLPRPMFKGRPTKQDRRALERLTRSIRPDDE